MVSSLSHRKFAAVGRAKCQHVTWGRWNQSGRFTGIILQNLRGFGSKYFLWCLVHLWVQWFSWWSSGTRFVDTFSEEHHLEYREPLLYGQGPGVRDQRSSQHFLPSLPMGIEALYRSPSHSNCVAVTDKSLIELFTLVLQVERYSLNWRPGLDESMCLGFEKLKLWSGYPTGKRNWSLVKAWYFPFSKVFKLGTFSFPIWSWMVVRMMLLRSWPRADIMMFTASLRPTCLPLPRVPTR